MLGLSVLNTFKILVVIFVSMVAFTTTILIVIPDNEQGPPGIQGKAGAVGPIGPEGDSGPRGIKGDTGAKGTKGNGFWGSSK